MRSSVLLLVALAAMVPAICAATLYVDAAGTNPVPPYASWETAAITIQEAVNAAGSGDEILVTNGVYATGEAVRSGETNRVAADIAVRIRSVNGPAVTRIVGDTQIRGVYLAAGASLQGFTVTGGQTASDGGGVRAETTSCMVSNCVIEANHADAHGGGTAGGSLYRCIIASNTAGSGIAGAIGGVLRDCAVRHNAGVGVAAGTLYHCTVAYNADLGSSSNSQFGCILYFNGPGGSYNVDSWLALQGCCVDGVNEPGLLSADPRFAAPDNLRLLGSSPCIDRTNGWTSTALDLAGLPRIHGWVADFGAYEFTPASCTGALAATIVPLDGLVATQFVTSLRFRAEIQGAPLDIAWRFGDGGAAEGLSAIEHVFPLWGPQSVVLVASNLETVVAVTQFVQVAALPALPVLTPAEFDLGTYTAGVPYVASFVVSNAGGLVYTGMASVGGAPFLLASSPVVDLPRGAWTTLLVGCSYGQSGVFTGELVVAGDGGAVTSRVRAALPPPLLHRSPALLNFGRVEEATAVQSPIVVSNAGGASLTGGVVTIDPPFGVLSASSFALAPGAATNLLVGLPPLAAGFYTGSVVLAGNGGGATSALQVSVGIVHRYVTTNGNDAADGATWATAKATIQGALDTLDATGGVVHVGPGSHATGQRTSPDGRASRVVVTNPVAIVSADGPRFTAIRGNPASDGVRCAYLAAGASLSGFTLTNGYSVVHGGGVYCASRAATLSNCVIAGNAAGNTGGGVVGGTLHNCLIVGNRANVGGGSWDGTLHHCTVVGNTAASFAGGTGHDQHYNTIVYYNQAPSSPDYNSAAFTDCCTTPLPPGVGNFADPPQLVTFDPPWLLPWSPCIDSGEDAFSRSALDLDGRARTNGPAVDVGATEFDLASCTGALEAVVVLPRGDRAGPGLAVPLQAAVRGRPTGIVWRFDDDTGITNELQCSRAFSALGTYTVRLLVTNLDRQASATATISVTVAPDPLVWSGGTNGVWDVGLTANWGNDLFVYSNGLHVRFDDTSTRRTVTRAGAVEPASVTVDTANEYHIDAGGSFTGAMSLIKTGTGSLHLGSNDTYTGDAFIVQGSVYMGGTAMGLAQIGDTYVSNGGTLVFSSTMDEHVHITGTGVAGQGALLHYGFAAGFGPKRITLDADSRFGVLERCDVYGTDAFLNLNGHTLEKVAPGQFSIVWSSVTNAGSILVTNGTLSLETGAVISGPGAITVRTNATLQYWRGPHVSKPVVLDGGRVYTFSVPCTAGAPHSVLSHGTIANASPLWFTNSISGPGLIHKSGTADVYFCASNSFTGALYVQNGFVDLMVAGAEGYRITNDALLRFSATNPLVLNTGFALRGGGLTVFDTPGGVTVGAGVDLAVTGTIQVAHGVPASLDVTSGAALFARQLLVGGPGVPGEVHQTGGEVRVSDLRVGQDVGATSRYILASGSLRSTNASPLLNYRAGLPTTGGVLCVGGDGCGEFVQQGGQVQTTGLILDDRIDSPGTDAFVLEGGTLTLGRLGVQGQASTRVLLGGGVVAAADTWSSSLPFELTGTNGSTVFDIADHTVRLPLPLSGNGGFIKNGSGTLVLGSSLNSYAGETTVAGGTLRLEAPLAGDRGALPPGRPVDLLPDTVLYLAAQEALGRGTGSVAGLLLDQATLSLATGLQATVGEVALHGGVIAAEGSGTYLLDGPLSTVAHSMPSVIASAALTLRGGIATSPVSFAVARGTAEVDLRVTSTLSGSGIHKTGPGILELAGINALAGPVAVSNGTLVVSGVLGSGDVAIASGAVLQGTGVVAGAVRAEGLIAPGAPFGRLTLQGTCTLSGASAVQIDVAGATQGPACDRLVLAQPVTLAGALIVSFTNGFVPASQEVFVAVSAPSIAGTFASVSIQGADAGWGALYRTNAVLIARTNATASDFPALACPPDLVLASPTSTIPPPDPAALIAVSTCATLTVTWAGDVTNAGTGCRGSPRIVTRSYAVASSCGTTSACHQFIRLEDDVPPVFTLRAGTAANLGFEESTSTAWQVFGPSNLVRRVPYAQRSGAWALELGVFPTVWPALDSSSSGGNGTYSTSTVLGRPPAVPALQYSAQFGAWGSVVTAGPLLTSTNSLTLTAWMRRTNEVSGHRGFLGMRKSTTNYTGLCMDSGNQLCYSWYGASNAQAWLSGIVAPASQWVFVALSVSPSNATIHQRSAAGWASATNNIAHAVIPFLDDLSIGRDDSFVNQFGGFLNDVQVYDRALDADEIGALWNGGAGDATLPGVLRRWKLNDVPATPTNQVFGAYQELAAGPGQRWRAMAWCRQSSELGLSGTNSVAMLMEFLNSAGTSLSNATVTVGPTLTASHVLRQVAGIAPTGTAKARLTFRYTQDAAGSPGLIYVDDCLFSDKLVLTGSGIGQCGTLTNLLTNAFVSASDAFSGTNLVWSQSPPPGSVFTSNRMDIVLRAVDTCGNTGSVSFKLDVVDTTAPLTFNVSPASTTLGCPGSLPTNSILFFDNCFVTNISRISSTTNSGTGCRGSPSVITNLFQATDLGGNIKTANQIVTRVDSNAPTISTNLPGLADPGFEAGSTGTAWSAAIVTNLGPRAGSFHALLAESTNASGPAQTLPAAAAQRWRLGAWALIPTNALPAPGSALQARLLFLDAASNALGTQTTAVATGDFLPGVYRQISITAIAPTSSAFVHASFVCAAPLDGAGAFFLDDASLSRTAVTLDAAGTAPLAALTDLATAVDTCSAATMSQSPSPGASLGPGTNLVLLLASDACLNTRTSVVQIVGIDETPPAFIAAPPDQVVAQIGDIPPPSLALVSAVDACSSVSVTNLPDLVGSGAGTTNDPLLVTRRYRATDVTGNVAEYRQTFYVGAALPTGYRLYAAGIPNAFAQGIADDPDGDGFANLLEYVTGGGATNADQISALRGLRASGAFSLVFSRATGAVDAILVVEGSHGATNNAAWQGLATNLNGSWGGATNVLETGTGTPVTVTVVDPLTGATNRFLRLKVSLP